MSRYDWIIGCLCKIYIVSAYKLNPKKREEKMDINCLNCHSQEQRKNTTLREKNLPESMEILDREYNVFTEKRDYNSGSRTLTDLRWNIVLR